MKATVHVFLKPGVLDVQGKAVESALHGLGWPGVSDVRFGRVIEFDLDVSDREAARSQVGAMCERLLANPVIEFVARGRRLMVGASQRRLTGQLKLSPAIAGQEAKAQP